MSKKNSKDAVSIYLCYLLRHHPEAAGLHMDKHGWVDVAELIAGVNQHSKYELDIEGLLALVAADEKGRYRVKDNDTRIKCCQGHSIPWVEPELVYGRPPEILYHGTTVSAWQKIRESGAIERMKRHAVHLQATEEKAWQSARRWKQEAVVLVIDAGKMADDGYEYGVSENGVWCVERMPTKYVSSVRMG